MTIPTNILSIIPLFVSSLVSASRVRQMLGSSLAIMMLFDMSLACCLFYWLPKPSIVPWWSPMKYYVSHYWPKLIKTTAPSWLVHGGPLGYGCGKVVEVLSAIFLWKCVHGAWPLISLGNIPGWKDWLGIIGLSLGTNLVLQLWSNQMKSRGDHQGVNDMVESTRGRSLSLVEKCQILGLALVNGTCEEITSRWFWMHEFQAYLSISHANLAQALVFGIWHYHGIPSGMTGVVLTFGYGLIMGCLLEYSQGGLFLPIVTHTIADYYIFAIIARQQQQQQKSTTAS